MDSFWWSAHTHSQFSPLDGMTPVPELVAKAAADGRPALGLTDHGNLAGTVQLYKSARQHDILPYPGVEVYIIDPASDDPTDGKARRYHACLLAVDLEGYRALVRAVSLSHTRPRFSRFPRLTVADLAKLGKESGQHLIMTTGCFFGLVQQRAYDESLGAARRVIKTYASWFPNLVVEVQNHNIEHDEAGTNDLTMAKWLVAQADEFGLPVMATQDSHYTHQRQRDAHALMKRMVYGGAEDEFPGDSFHLASADWVKEHFHKVRVNGRLIWDRVEETSKHLIGLNKLDIPYLNTYKAQVPTIVKDGFAELKKLSGMGLAILTSGMSAARASRYTKRWETELDVVKFTGTADYFILVRQVVEWCHENKVCIEARGSANGSLLCYLLGITQIDPLKYGTLFERFLSKDRIRPPDIDLDIESSRRGELLAWLAKTFPTVQIGTWAELGTSAANSERGSVLVTYQMYLRRKAMEMAERIGEQKGLNKGETTELGRRIFGKRYSHIQAIEDVAALSRLDYVNLKELARMKSVYRSYGVHAAGVLIGSDTFPLDDYIPTMLVASSNTRVTQYDMDDVEEWGPQKLDVLGQQTLTIMRLCQELMGRGASDDFTWIPDNDRLACKILRSGVMDNGIFHFEGYTKAKGGREMGIRTTRDTILASALYMPGAMESGQKDLYLKGRRDKTARNRKLRELARLHPIFAEVLKETFGAVVFQEQPLAIMRRLGMSIENINVLFKVVKDSGKGAIERNRERLDKLRKEFNYLCQKHGIKKTDEAWHLVTGFIAYGFNMAHATGYGLRSYRCAYLKAHHPLEFMTALLTVWAGTDKETLYQREARRLGIRLLNPDVNISGASWSIDRKRGAIRRGLVSIPGIGDAAAQAISAGAPYQSVDDLLTRVPGRALSGGKEYYKTGAITGKLKALMDVGALDSIR